MDNKEINNALNTYVRPQTFPIAIKLCQSEGELPEKVKIPKRDLGYQVILCQAIGLARRFGWTLAIGKEDQICVGGAQVMGSLPENVQGPVDKEKRLEPGKYSHLLIAPLERATFEPDVLAIYGNSAQIMRLVQSATGGLGGTGKVNAVATGAGDCGDIIARTFLTDECQSILPSGGDRVYGSTQDHQFIFTMPKSKIGVVAEGLAK